MVKLWQLRSALASETARRLPQYDAVVLQLLYNRGLVEAPEINQFLRPDFNKNCHDPFLFNNMDRAVDLIIKHIKAGSGIMVYGDYDADGVTAAALLVETLKTLRARVDIYIPDRVSQGYGLSNKAIDEINKTEAKLIVTVDGGIRNRPEVDYLKSLGKEIIITDHHIAPAASAELPDCLIINPTVKGEKYPEKNLAGAGVAYKLAQALILKSTLESELKNKLLERSLDLVAIGTVADCVSLTGENRVLVKRGLAALNKTSRPGLKELISLAGINNGKKIDSWNISFQIAPRLNAAGRLDHASAAFELLITADLAEAKALANRLQQRNIDRQKMTEKILKAAEQQLKAGADEKIIISVCREDFGSEVWNEGVIGLVAGKISEKYYRPALVVTRSEAGYKGSGRSIEEFNLITALEKTADLLEKYGGHPAACGFSLEEKNLDKFIKKIRRLAGDQLAGLELAPKLIIEAEVEYSQINDQLLETVELLAPFGQNNPRPVFMTRNLLIKDIVRMGLDNQHVKFRINNIWALAFGRAEDYSYLQAGDSIDLVYYLQRNEFNGRSELQLKVVDIKKYAEKEHASD